jgi:hypothetical protein
MKHWLKNCSSEKNALTQEEYIVAIELWEQYHSLRCWKTKEMVVEVYNKLKSESARLSVVKEQILIRYLGLVGRMCIILGRQMEKYLTQSIC